jgi:hypothetical protein
MSLDDYLAQLDAQLSKLQALITASSIEREIDSTIGLGMIRGQISFVDGSRFEFMEQLPVERQKFRMHYMNAENQLIARWDSAPHHRELPTFPFHKHVPEGVQAHPATTVVQVLDEIVKMLKG